MFLQFHQADVIHQSITCYHPPMLRLAPALALLILTLPPPALADITGKPRVVDGDTIHIGKTKIRLHGIDAPIHAAMRSSYPN